MHNTATIINYIETEIEELEVSVRPFEQRPLAVLPETKRCYDDIVSEFEEFNTLNWDQVDTLDIARLSEPYIMMPLTTFYYLLPKFFKAVLREAGQTEMVETVFDMILRTLHSSDELAMESVHLTPRQIRLIYCIASELEWMVFGTRDSSIADEYLEDRLGRVISDR